MTAGPGIIYSLQHAAAYIVGILANETEQADVNDYQYIKSEVDNFNQFPSLHIIVIYISICHWSMSPGLTFH